MADKVYKIAVEIAAVNGLGPVLRVLSRDMLGMGHQATLLTSKIKGLRVAAIGAAAALGGIAILRGAWGLAEYGNQLANVQSRLRQMGVSAQNTAAMTNAAFSASTQTPNVKWSDALAVLTKGRTVLGSSAESIKASQTMVRVEGILDNWGMGGPTAMGQLLKAVELAGGAYGTDGKSFSVAALKQSLQDILEAQDITGKLLTPAQIMQATKLAGAAPRMMGAFSWWSGMAEAAQQMGPSGGRGFAMVMKALSGGPISRLYAYNLQKYGLVGADGFVKIPHTFQTAIKSGALKGSDILYGNGPKDGLFGWVNRVLVPTLEAHGVHGTRALLAAVYQTVSSQTGSRLVANMITNAISYERTQAQMKQAGSVDIYGAQMSQSMAGPVNALSGAFGTLLQVLGGPLVQPAIAAINSLTGVVQGITAWSKIHPERIKLIVEGIAGLGAALVVFGTAAVVGALVVMSGIPAAIAAAVTAMAAAFTIILANFKDFKSGLENIFSIGGSDDHSHMHEVSQRRGRYQFPAWVPDAGYAMQGKHAIPSAEPNPTVTLHPASVAAVARAIHHGLTGSLSAPAHGSSGFNGRQSGYGSPATATP